MTDRRELEEQIAARRADEDFMARVRRLIDENREALDLLAQSDRDAEDA